MVGVIQGCATGVSGSARLAGLLSYYLDGVHGIDLRSLVEALEGVLAVLGGRLQKFLRA
ncbi:hypothetical protein OG978_44390 (plasmid) [Streptomyces sp. NBC_01591]|uniref:hypothetical protein n=1 Tax=Streptomyces sp. NBC_01591 TaxID=2975888 RepID=UPI002DDAC6CC|nr:hypothetical protein [Streptomyces sp. NBC_01591]WSD74160.1 hypothetical protein OG978_44390 [Streptomyces sp. NBC_01591]